MGSNNNIIVTAYTSRQRYTFLVRFYTIQVIITALFVILARRLLGAKIYG